MTHECPRIGQSPFPARHSPSWDVNGRRHSFAEFMRWAVPEQGTAHPPAATPESVTVSLKGASAANRPGFFPLNVVLGYGFVHENGNGF